MANDDALRGFITENMNAAYREEPPTGMTYHTLYYFAGVMSVIEWERKVIAGRVRIIPHVCESEDYGQDPHT